MRISRLALILYMSAAQAAFAGPVADAAKKGDIAEIERLIASGADINEPGSMISPLHTAAMNGHAEAVRVLAAAGAELDSQSAIGTPLHAASVFGKVEAVQALLAAGANPDARDRDDFTPLMRAALKGQVAAAEQLLAGGADVDAVGLAPGGGIAGKGPTIALHIARLGGNDALVGLLAQAGAAPIPPEVPEDLATLGNAERGNELAHTFCAECHTVSAEAEPQLGHPASGPPLIGIMGRPIADLPGFEYSEALLAEGGDWTPELLYAFALRPMLTVPGTRMNWAPDRTPEMIADITAYFVSVAE